MTTCRSVLVSAAGGFPLAGPGRLSLMLCRLLVDARMSACPARAATLRGDEMRSDSPIGVSHVSETRPKRARVARAGESEEINRSPKSPKSCLLLTMVQERVSSTAWYGQADTVPEEVRGCPSTENPRSCSRPPR